MFCELTGGENMPRSCQALALTSGYYLSGRSFATDLGLRHIQDSFVF